MGAVSGCCPELRREMHGRESGHPGKIGESDALFEMRADIILGLALSATWAADSRNVAAARAARRA